MNIIYDGLKHQEYILSDKFSNENVNLLYRLRSRTTDVKGNFKTKFLGNLQCSLGCADDETQEHLLSCKPIIDKLPSRQGAASILYEDLFDSKKQLVAVNWFSECFEVREELLSSQN